MSELVLPYLGGSGDHPLWDDEKEGRAVSIMRAIVHQYHPGAPSTAYFSITFCEHDTAVKIMLYVHSGSDTKLFHDLALRLISATTQPGRHQSIAPPRPFVRWESYSLKDLSAHERMQDNLVLKEALAPLGREGRLLLWSLRKHRDSIQTQ